jgi:hypothetical protein
MHQLKASHRTNGGTIDNLRQTLPTLLKTNYQAETILQMMLAEATRLFPGLTVKDHQSIVSCIIENVAVADQPSFVPVPPGTSEMAFDNVIPFPTQRLIARQK